MADTKRRIEIALLRRFPNHDLALKHFGELLIEWMSSAVTIMILARRIRASARRDGLAQLIARLGWRRLRR